MSVEEAKKRLAYDDCEKVRYMDENQEVKVYIYGQPIINGISAYQVHEKGKMMISYEAEQGNVIRKKKLFKAELNLIRIREVN